MKPVWRHMHVRIPSIMTSEQIFFSHSVFSTCQTKPTFLKSCCRTRGGNFWNYRPVSHQIWCNFSREQPSSRAPCWWLAERLNAGRRPLSSAAISLFPTTFPSTLIVLVTFKISLSAATLALKTRQICTLLHPPSEKNKNQIDFFLNSFLGNLSGVALNKIEHMCGRMGGWFLGERCGGSTFQRSLFWKTLDSIVASIRTCGRNSSVTERRSLRFQKKTRPDALLQLQVGLLLSRTTFSSETSEETFVKLSKESI